MDLLDPVYMKDDGYTNAGGILDTTRNAPSTLQRNVIFGRILERQIRMAHLEKCFQWDHLGKIISYRSIKNICGTNMTYLWKKMDCSGHTNLGQQKK